MNWSLIISIKRILSTTFRFIKIVVSKLIGKKIDYFLLYKYCRVKRFYGKKCLDIGAGTGRFSEFLRGKSHNVSSIDVVDLSHQKGKTKISIFDGKKIPFRNKIFDTSLLMFVLHHTNDQDELIKDCIRVTKNFLIIGEDIIQNQVDTIFGNIHLNSSPWSKGTDSFKTHPNWIKFFAKHNLELINTVTIPRFIYPVYPVSRKIYVLKVR